MLDRVTKIAVKQLVLWSHKTHSKQDQGVKNLAKSSPWFQEMLDIVRKQKIVHKTTSALEPKNTE